MTAPLSDAYADLLRSDLSLMIRKCFSELHPHTPYQHNWHIDVMAEKLMDCFVGKIKRLIINMPPRNLKSICVSIALPAWWFGHNPSAEIICASYGQDLSQRLAQDCRTIMQTSWYQALFPRTRLRTNRQPVNDFQTTMQGVRLATSVGGPVTGRGADVIIIDDPTKPDEAISDTQRRNCNDWFDGTIYSRMNSKKDGCIIIVMQRLHEDDLTGHVLGQEPWEVVSFPAIAEVDETHNICLPSGDYVHQRFAGEALHPEREPLENLEHMRRVMGGYNFAGQYQQSPSPLGGGMIKDNWFKICEPGQMPDSFDQIVQSVDTASKEGELNDYSVCITFGLKGKNIYIINIVRKRLNFPDLKRMIREQYEAFKPSTILIEDKSSGIALIQELLHERLYCVKKCTPEGDKVMRMHGQTACIENGFVYLPKDAHWLPEFMKEVTSFPKGKFDDQVDALSQALAWLQAAPYYPGWGMMEYYRQEYEKKMNGG